MAAILSSSSSPSAHISRHITSTLLSFGNFSALIQLIKARRGAKSQLSGSEILQGVKEKTDEIIKETIQTLYEAADESAETNEAQDNYAEVNA